MSKIKPVCIFMIITLLFFGSVSYSAGYDLNKSITIGNGSKTVIEFTDPDCPFCRKASKYFESRHDVTRHIFFFPLPRHPKAKEKAQYILSQINRGEAYHAIMSGSMDKEPSFPSSQHGAKLLEEQLQIAKKAKITATPTFIINGRIIEGFDLKKIEESLGK